MSWVHVYTLRSVLAATVAPCLVACGGEVAGTAATAAALEAKQAQQAKAQQQQFNAKLGEAMKAVDASASAADAP